MIDKKYFMNKVALDFPLGYSRKKKKKKKKRKLNKFTLVDGLLQKEDPNIQLTNDVLMEIVGVPRIIFRLYFQGIV